MSGPGRVPSGGGLGAVPGGPQKGAMVVPDRRPPFQAPFGSTAGILVSDANGVDPNIVRHPSDRSWGILARRSPRKPDLGGHR